MLKIKPLLKLNLNDEAKANENLLFLVWISVAGFVPVCFGFFFQILIQCTPHVLNSDQLILLSC